MRKFNKMCFRGKCGNMENGKNANASRGTSMKNGCVPQINAYIVIGDPNMGKSSVLRHLYGVPRGLQKSSASQWINQTVASIRRKMIALVTNQNIEVCMQGYCSLQEVDINQFVYESGVLGISPPVSNVIMALQLNDAKNRKGWDAVDYVKHFQNKGWNVVAIAVLDSNLLHVQSNYWKTIFPNCNCLTVYSTLNGNPTCPTNAVASIVRNHFGWL